MRRSEAFLPTRREARGEARADVRLAVRAGLVHRFGGGIYGFSPAGQRVHERIANLVDREMRAVGGQRVSLPQLQYRQLWEESGRWAGFEGEMFTFENRNGREMCLAPSHEEGAVELLRGQIRSYEDLPLVIYQIEDKHRDDHARNGLIRTKEFSMKDAYSFHSTSRSLDEWYEKIRETYCRIFDALDLPTAITGVDDSVMGGPRSEEFHVPVDNGTCELVHCSADDCRFGVTGEHRNFSAYRGGDTCPDCGASLHAGEGIEVGHVFQLGTRYSEAIGLTIDTANGGEDLVEMGSYGIGIARVLQTLIQYHADDDGCRWPATANGTIAPFEVAIVPLEYEGALKDAADRLHDAGTDVLLFDDADQTLGERFAESDLLGIPTKIVLGNHFRDTGEVEVESRDGDTRYVDIDAAKNLVSG